MSLFFHPETMEFQLGFILHRALYMSFYFVSVATVGLKDLISFYKLLLQLVDVTLPSSCFLEQNHII